MSRIVRAVLLLGALCVSAPARADTIDVEGRLTRQDGSAIAGQSLRVVIGSEKDPRAPQAGGTVVTDADGRFSRTVEAPVERRWITLDSIVPHRPLHIAVGVELELLGRRTLYWIDLDSTKGGVLSKMVAYPADGNGRFDRPLAFKSPPPTYAFPDDPGGVQLSGIGAELKSWDMRLADAPDGRKRWTVRIEIEKHEFQRR